MEKIKAIEETNRIINERIERIKKSFDKRTIPIFDSGLDFEVIHEGSNEETSYTICKIYGGQKTENLKEKEFKRIVCLKGKLKIHIPTFDEETTMSSPNGILIPPNTVYSIETLVDCEVMAVYKPRKTKKEVNLLKERIYRKENS